MMLSALTLAASLTLIPTKADVNWIGVSVPNPDVIWLSGSNSHIARSSDAGETWEYFQPATQNLQFRDIEALDANHAYALSIGNNGDSRIYYTSNGGRNWQLRYRAGGNQFLNCMALSATNEAWVYGDTVENRWNMVRSVDGRNWLTASNMVDTQPLSDEGGLAASGGCLRHNNGIWAIGTANGNTARLLVKRNFGIRFKAIDTPLPAGPSAGIASVWPFSEKHILLAGGSLNHAEAKPRLVEYKDDQFTALTEPPLSGALYSLTVRNDGSILVTNPTGAALLNSSRDAWQTLAEANIWNSACSTNSCYLVGKDGYLAKVTFDQ